MALFFSERIRAMRTYLALGEAASVKRSLLGFVSLPRVNGSGRQSGCKSRPWGPGLQRASSFNAAGVGSSRLATDGTGV